MTILSKRISAPVILHFAVLLLFAVVFLFIGTGHVQLVDWDENIYAEASRQMMVRGDYLNVYVNNHLFSEKPPFFFWEQVLSYRLFGVNEFAARFPSGVAGVLMIILFFHIGRKLGSPEFGLIWGLVYLTSFLPSVFGRVSVIDHTFNLFIAGGAYFLYLFDSCYRSYLLSAGGKSQPAWIIVKPHLLYLTAGSICMGLAFLTKGPLGGVIPLVAFAGYKLANRQPRIRLSHFIYCAVLSLTIALSWYVAVWLTTGESFLSGFIRFQLMLFSKPLEGHGGPVFYHLVVGLIGLLPWTPFLFMIRPQRVSQVNQHFLPLYRFNVAWVGFVLILFSLVSTKLPHYSASIYIPLSMIVAFNIHYGRHKQIGVPNWVITLFLLLGLGLASLFIAIPMILKEYAKIQLVEFPEISAKATYLIGVLIGLFFLGSAFYMYRKKLVTGVIIAALSMFIFTQGLWQIYLPVFIDIHQKPLLQLLSEAHQKSDQVVFYRMVSFAAFFYGGKPIEILHNYKFPGNPALLDKRPQNDLYVICDIRNADKLQVEHPLVEKLKQNGRFCLFKISADQKKF